MNYTDIKSLLTELLPIGIVCFGTAFVKFVKIKEEGSIFSKILNLFASSVFGIIVGYIDTKFNELRIVLIVSVISTLITDTTINWITKNGWTEVLKQIKIKIGSTPDNSDQNAKQ